MIRTIIITAITVLVLNACSGIKPYRTNVPANLKINAKTESVNATLNIYEINKHCQTIYLGTVRLDKENIAAGLPTDKPSYLVVGFTDSSFLGGTRSSMSYDILVKPRGGYRYELNVSYVDDIYNVAFFEINKSNGKKNELEPKKHQDCL